MSVMIKGMKKMPKDCPYCKMAYYNASDEFTGCSVIPNKRYAMHNDAVYAKSTKRPDWCPLVEIPAPHGRLIEVTDELLIALSNFIAETGIDEAPYMSASDWIEMNAPTVIEGERTNA